MFDPIKITKSDYCLRMYDSYLKNHTELTMCLENNDKECKKCNKKIEEYYKKHCISDKNF